MSAIGFIEADRLEKIPERFWGSHEFCFFLHDQVLNMLREYEASGTHNLVVNALSNERHKQALGEDVDILKLLKNTGLVTYYKHHIVSHLVLGLTADLLHFLYESLHCFEKRKFAVGFSLLRKPLKENLLFLCWLLGDEDDFVLRFEKDNYSTLNGITPERRQDILSKAIDKLSTKAAFAADLLDDMIFSKAHSQGFEQTWQRATHLITSQGSQLKTPDLSINFIFHDAGSDEFYELLYSNLPYIMLFCIQVALECFARIAPTNSRTTSHLILCSMGAYESLFPTKKAAPVTALVRRLLKPFLTCPHCDAGLRLTRSNALNMYLHETLVCGKCSLASPFPLYWLLAKGNLNIGREDGTAPILDEFKVAMRGKRH